MFHKTFYGALLTACTLTFPTVGVMTSAVMAAQSVANATAERNNLSGNWILYVLQNGEKTDSARVRLQQNGNVLTGTLNELKLTGTVANGSVTGQMLRPDGKAFGGFTIQIGTQVDLHGTIRRSSGNEDILLHKIGGEDVAPQTRVFIPTKYYRVFSGSIAPVMHINSGDTVKTTTVDAGGYDMHNISRSAGGNPETGPFYVEGAMPGDTLAVTIKSLTLNRDSALSNASLIPRAVTPMYFRSEKLDDSVSGDWKLDREHGTATPAKPTEKLKNFKVALKPMLGCVGVAPGNNTSFRTQWLGPWGGNMDFHGVGQGATVYLPVAEEGALLFVGDAHAEEGDGELNGDALETSADVEFTVKVIPGGMQGEASMPRIGDSGPRVENDEYLMTMGIGGSLDEALQKATSNLAQWIERDYKLTPNEAAMVLGTSIHYEIAEVADPQVNIVAKISKAALAQISK